MATMRHRNRRFTKKYGFHGLRVKFATVDDLKKEKKVTDPDLLRAALELSDSGKASNGHELSPNGTCQEEGCGKPVTGERRFCGQCARKR